MDKTSRTSDPRKLAIWASVLLAVFLLGYIPSWLSARSARAEAALLDHNLKVAKLLGELGMVSYEASRNNFASASNHSTQFFNGLKLLADETRDPALKSKLESFVPSRDEITADVAKAEPAVKEKVANMYASFYQLTVP
ncbi:MAG: hypothetical protein HYX72_15150 [Acidobacteria bacterium]|nr:hypothetical protein [Acidobacteriota bacterium]